MPDTTPYPRRTVDTVVAALAGGIASILLTLSIGGGTTINKHVRTTANVDVQSMGAGQSTSTNVALSGAAVGDTCFAQSTAGDLIGTTSTLASLPCRVTATDTATVYFYNATGTSSFNPGASTISVQLWKY